MEILTLTAATGELLVAKADVMVASGGRDISIPEGGMDVPIDSGVKDPLLSSWPFVIGISTVVLAVSIVVGVLLAKLKIKKGIDLYED